MYRHTAEEIGTICNAACNELRYSAALIDHAVANAQPIKHTTRMAENAAISMGIAAAAVSALAEHATGEEEEPSDYALDPDITLKDAVHYAYTVTRLAYGSVNRLCREVAGTGLADPALKANMRLSEADIALSYANLVLGGDAFNSSLHLGIERVRTLG